MTSLSLLAGRTVSISIFESHNIDSGVFLMCDNEEMTSMKASNEINICP